MPRPEGTGLRNQAQRWASRLTGAAAPLLVLALAACDAPAQWGPPAIGIVYGNVTDATGAHLARATVAARALDTDCSANASFPFRQDTTAADGHYRIEVATSPGIGEYDACVGVTAAPPVGSALTPRTLVGARVTLHSPPLAPPESVRVDIQLQP